ncbi:MAG: glutamate-5-semialdehyde dehydrogenase [Bacteroidales bacterium]|nr:glutamate-5-semialdehyde dehydrogenase [Bacteroidales bacterium]
MNTFEAAKRAAAQVALLPDAERVAALEAVADAICAKSAELLAANAEDLARMDPQNPLYDRLKLTPERLAGIASDMRDVAHLPSPLGRTLEDRTLPNGLRLRKVSVPFGVIGVVYEARPNVTFDVFSLCFKSGNACVLKGGKDADASNRAALALIRGVLAQRGLPESAVTLLPPTHEAVGELLGAVGYVDLVIPRGGRRLIDFVRDNAKVPCLETGAGVVDTYFDAAGDLEIGRRIVLNAKTRRVSVCNALDCLIVHRDRLADLPALVEPLAEKNVIIYADEAAYAALAGRYPLLEHATPDSFGTEYMDYKMSVRTVASIDEALAHIARYGSGHSESIITADAAAATRFQAEVDAACVYVNAPTSFTDGAQFGLGAEIGISTQKLGARGPMGLCEITTYKWLIDGNGQTRP